jgi:acetyl-CoA carboxylase biotin carboxyl carrier protein
MEHGDGSGRRPTNACEKVCWGAVNTGFYAEGQHAQMAEIEVKTEVTGSVWRIATEIGQKVEAGDTIMVIESMKMEIPVVAEGGGTIRKFLVEEKMPVSEGQVVALLTR